MKIVKLKEIHGRDSMRPNRLESLAIVEEQIGFCVLVAAAAATTSYTGDERKFAF